MKPQQLLHYKDFLTVSMHIKLKNLVSDTIVDSKTKAISRIPFGKPSDTNLIQLIEILPNGLALSAPKYICTLGHNLEIELLVTNLEPKPIKLQLYGKVKGLEKTSEEQDRIEIDLQNTADLDWLKFCKLFSDRQNAVHEFFSLVRGY